MLTDGYPLNVLENDTDEFKVLFRKLGVFI